MIRRHSHLALASMVALLFCAPLAHDWVPRPLPCVSTGYCARRRHRSPCRLRRYYGFLAPSVENYFGGASMHLCTPQLEQSLSLRHRQSTFNYTRHERFMVNTVTRCPCSPCWPRLISTGSRFALGSPLQEHGIAAAREIEKPDFLSPGAPPIASDP